MMHAHAPAHAPALAAAKASQPKPVIQRKARLGAENDPLEREADRAAATVMAGGDILALSRSGMAAQRKCAHCEEEEKKTVRRKGGGPAAQTSIDAAASAVRSGGAPLTPAQRAYFEPRFGHDFSAVRLHTDTRAQRAAEGIGARAYTYGSAISLAAGETADALLAHELAHVVQQSGTCAFAGQVAGVRTPRTPAAAAPPATSIPSLGADRGRRTARLPAASGGGRSRPPRRAGAADDQRRDRQPHLRPQ